jgi:shikimate dehydrogenase
MKINAHTKLLALFGWPVEHSLSPDMHNAAFDEMGINYCYMAIPVKPEDLPDAVNGIRAWNVRGVNITVPHKEKVIPLLDELDSEAQFIGAVNTIVNSDGKLKGYNTDGRGFMQSLKEENILVKGKNVLVIGAGGASRAIGYYLAQEAKRLSIYDVDREKLTALIKDLNKVNPGVRALENLNSIKDEDVIINATPLGLKETDPMPVELSLLNRDVAVGDLIYRETPLQKKAREMGFQTFNGLGMLLWQGVLASELWTGKRPPENIMREALLKGIGK